MSNSLRFGTALSALALATFLSGCATPGNGARESLFGDKVDRANIGVATRAMIALNSNDFATAISLGERAVANSPSDAGFRALLGNAYFASGRFASAEAAYADALSLFADQPAVVLKLALAQIAQGKRDHALSLLAAARNLLEPADYGLAVALAGQPQHAVEALDTAARQPGADARLRQNLALAHALAGDWAAARTIAAQDLTADLVEQRVQQWMSLAQPARAADQVAALTGVKPAASDPGQPTRLALRQVQTRTAQAAPAPQAAAQLPQFAPAPAPAAVQAAVPAPAPMAYEPPAESQPFAAVAPAVPAQPAPEPAFAAAEPAPMIAPAVAEAEPEYVVPRPRPVFKAAQTRGAKLVHKLPPARPAVAVRARGNSTAVVQLGAYGSPERVAAAWNDASRRFAVLRAYSPVSARFNSPKGLVHRLSVRGFANAREAASLCTSLRRSGGSCFVRTVAGDTPVQFASR